jgi:hypothetical protein
MLPVQQACPIVFDGDELFSSHQTATSSQNPRLLRMFRPQHHGDRMHPCNNSNLPGQRTTVSHRQTIAVNTFDRHRSTNDSIPLSHPSSAKLGIACKCLALTTAKLGRNKRGRNSVLRNTDINSCINQYIPISRQHQYLQLPLQCHAYTLVYCITHER